MWRLRATIAIAGMILGQGKATPVGAGTPDPLVRPAGVYWPGPGNDAYILHSLDFDYREAFELYRLPDGSDQLELIAHFPDQPGVLLSAVAVVMFPGEPGEYFYFSPYSSRRLNLSNSSFEGIGGRTSVTLFDLKSRTIIVAEGSDKTQPGFPGPMGVHRRDIDTGELTQLSGVPNVPGHYFAGPGLFPIATGPNELVWQGVAESDCCPTPVRLRIDYSTPAADVEFLDFDPMPAEMFHSLNNGVISLVCCGGTGIHEYNILTDTTVRVILTGILWGSHTNYEVFAGAFGEVVEETGTFFTDIPVAIFANDFADRIDTRLRLRHPTELAPPEAYLDHLLGNGQVNEILYAEPDRNNDGNVDIADFILRLNEVNAEDSKAN